MYKNMYNEEVARTVAFTQARKDLTRLLDQVAGKHEHVVITRNGLPAAVMISLDEYESLQETLEVLDDTESMSALRESEEDVKAGRVSNWRDVKRSLRLG
jgi:prevent-host-death family protein